MSLIKRMRKRYAVYWAPVGTDEEGQPSFEGPVEIRCRWENHIIEFRDYRGRTTVSRALVYVDRPLLCGGILWRGRLADVTAEVDPFKNASAWEIMAFGDVETLRGNETMYTALL
jgi:hypothetical protein